MRVFMIDVLPSVVFHGPRTGATVAGAFLSQACAGEICRADVGKLEGKDNQFEVNSGAQNPILSGKQY